MKKNFHFFNTFLFVALLFCSHSLFAQDKSFTFPVDGNKTGFVIQRSAEQGLLFRHFLQELTVEDYQTQDAAGEILAIQGIHLPAQAGAPNLPSISRIVAIPQGATASLVIKEAKKQLISNVDLLPAPAIPLANDDSPVKYTKDEKIYSQDTFYPADPFLVSEPTQIRGVDVVMVGITPFQYNPQTKELIVYYDIEAEVVFEGGNGVFGDDRLRSIWWEPILQDHIFNSNMLPNIDFSAKTLQHAASRDEGAEYLIITPNGAAFTQWADSIRVFRQRQGITTKVVSLEEIGGNTAVAIKNYVINAYNSWSVPPAAVLLLGDYHTDGNQGIVSNLLNDHPGYYNPYISDNPFSDMSGNNLPDVIFARITARNANELEHMIHKFLDYERTPPTNAGFYNNPITAMGWQTERWFQICSETVNGFWEHVLGKSPVRENAIYSGNPGGSWSSNTNTSMVVNYFGPNGLNYIPANTAHLTDWGGNATRLNNDINSGAFMLQHRDHGLETGWGEPDYRNNHLSGLNNQDLTFVLSINCLTGKFNYSSECFTEAFHRHSHGALGLIAATEVSYSFVNDVFVWGAYDNMWPEFMPDYGSTPAERGILPAFANAAGKYFLQQSNWPYNPEHKNITYKLFHHHGDAFMTVYSEMPQSLTVEHMSVLLSGMEVFEVTANEGALIAITVDNEIIGAGIGTGNPVQIPIITQEPGVQALVTVTLQNYYRYEQSIECIPPSGPYLLYNSYAIDDSEGNNNGQIDYGETISLDVTLRNVGSETAENVSVSVSCESAYISLLNESFEMGDIEAGTLATVENAFSFTVSDEIPNMYSISFILTIQSGSNEWSSSFSVPAYAPEFEVLSYTIDDSSGNNNGRLDPGETVQIVFNIINKGQSDAFDALASFMNNCPYLNIAQTVHQIEHIEAEEQFTVTYQVSVSEGAPVGSVASFGFQIEAGAYTAQADFNTKIGLVIEDFETGDFNQFDWTHGGNKPWEIVSVDPYSGNFAAKSGAIGHSQNSQLSILFDVGMADTISFYYKVSSEKNYDHLWFFIDNVKLGEWNGTIEWTKASFPVEAGMHTFRWEYKKDYSVSNGQDCAWLDDIVFPPMVTTSAWAGADIEICDGNTVQLNGSASYYESLLWTSSGSGTFDNASILNPVYSPSTADYEAGSVQLSLTATGTTTVTDNLTVVFHPEAEVFAGQAMSICAEDHIELSEAWASNFASLLWSSTGDGSFDDPTVLHAVYYPGEEDISSQGFVLTLHATGLGDCPAVESSVELTIYPQPVIEGPDTIQNCIGQELWLNDYLSVQHMITCQWSTEGDGSFTDPENFETAYIPGASDIANGHVTIQLIAYGESECEPVTTGLSLMFHELPTVVFSEPQDICQGDEAIVEIVLTGDSPWELELNDPFETLIIEESPYQLVSSPMSTTQLSVIRIQDSYCVSESDATTWIHVFEIPQQAEILAGPDTVDYNDGYETVYEIVPVPFAQEYTLIIEPEESGSSTEHEAGFLINWDPDFLGEVALYLMASNFCGQGELSDPKVVQIISTIGISEQNTIDLHIYPNPAHGQITIKSSRSVNTSLMIRLTDVLGKVMRSKQIESAADGFTHQLDIADIPNGIYFLRVEGDGVRSSLKLLIQ